MVGAVAISLWTLLLPSPTVVVVALTLLPPAVIAVAWGLGDRVALLAPAPERRRHNLTPLLLLPPLGLAMTAQFDFQLVGWRPALGGAALIGALLVALAVVAAGRGGHDMRRSPLAIVALLLFTGLPYGWGALLQWNGRLDAGAPEIEERVVLAKSDPYARRTDRYVRLAPRAPGGPGERVSVALDVTARAGIGGPVCDVIRPGAFGIAYRRIAICADVGR